jgi:hypothetical protein
MTPLMSPLLIEPKVRDCSFRLHTTLPFPTHLGPLDLYLDSHRSIANTRGSPLHYRNTRCHITNLVVLIWIIAMTVEAEK